MNIFRKSSRETLLATSAVRIPAWDQRNDGLLNPVMLTDIYGPDITDLQLPLSRDEALTVPAVAKVRSLLVATIAGLPLRAMDKTGPLEVQPTFLYRDDVPVTPVHRMSMTVDDLLFYGASLWTTDRGSEGQITNAEWVPRAEWAINQDGAVEIRSETPTALEYLLFYIPGFSGLLVQGARTLRAARDIEMAHAQKSKNPIPLINLHLTDETERTQAEIDALLASFRRARRDPEGAVSVTPSNVEIEEFGLQAPSLLESGRNAIVTNVGQHTNVRAAMLDGTASIDSLTYTTKDGERNSFLDFDLPYWTGPIEATLSAAVPRGQRVRFDTTQLIHAPVTTGNPTED